MAKKKRALRGSLHFPSHALSPEDLLHFIEVGNFTKNWEALGLDDEDDLTALQFMIMAQPRGAPVVQNTGGLRKLRFAPASWNTGSSGAARVCYVYFEEYGIVLLVTVYDKHATDDLSAMERKAIRALIAEAELALARRERLA